MPATNAMILISMCVFANLFVIHILLEYFLVVKIDFSSNYNIYIFVISLGVVVYLINYFYLYKNREKLNNKYKNEDKNKRTIGNVLLILYVLGSFALVFYFGPKYTASIMN
jgi:hypothetical protein